MRKLLISFTLMASLLVGACSVHRIDIQQGNIVTPEMREQVTLGMSKEQVLFLMGTPLIIDLFNNDRWDYIYTLVKPRSERKEKRLTFFFQDDKVVSYITDVTAPGESEP